MALTAAKADQINYMRDSQATLEKWRKQYGLGAPSTGQSGASGGNAVPPDVLAKAKDAIAKGAPRDAVIKRLRDAGFNPSGL